MYSVSPLTVVGPIVLILLFIISLIGCCCYMNHYGKKRYETPQTPETPQTAEADRFFIPPVRRGAGRYLSAAALSRSFRSSLRKFRPRRRNNNSHPQASYNRFNDDVQVYPLSPQSHPSSSIPRESVVLGVNHFQNVPPTAQPMAPPEHSNPGFQESPYLHQQQRRQDPRRGGQRTAKYNTTPPPSYNELYDGPPREPNVHETII